MSSVAATEKKNRDAQIATLSVVLSSSILPTVEVHGSNAALDAVQKDRLSRSGRNARRLRASPGNVTSGLSENKGS